MHRAFLFTFLYIFLSSCSSFNESGTSIESNLEVGKQESPEPDVSESDTGVEEESEAEVPDIDDEDVSVIEIEWRAPKTKVLRYILRYGSSPDNLDSEKTIELTQLKVEHHSLHGKLYKYLLLGFPDKSVVYYTLQAENEFGLSEPTPVAKEEAK